MRIRRRRGEVAVADESLEEEQVSGRPVDNRRQMSVVTASEGRTICPQLLQRCSIGGHGTRYPAG